MSVNTATPEVEGARPRGTLSVALVVEPGKLAERLRATLERNDVDCLTEVGSVEELAQPVAGQHVDAIVLRSGGTAREIVEAFKAARAAFPRTPIVGLWPDAQHRQYQRALKAGIDGLIHECSVDQALLPTIRAVCSELICFPRRRPVDSQCGSLSSREKQVLGMLIMGFTNAEIARRLYLAESTVKSHLSSAYLKLGVRSRKDAAALILDPDEGLGTSILAISGA